QHIVRNGAPDVLFLDVDMPGQTGLDLRNKLMDTPACIFITAHPEFALDGFELAALDYMIKPPTEERLKKVMRRLYEYLTVHSKAQLYDVTAQSPIVVIKEGHGQVKLPLKDVLYLEAM